MLALLIAVGLREVLSKPSRSTTAMYPVDRHEPWTPSWSPPPEATGALLARHYESGLRIDLSVGGELVRCRTWLVQWLTAFEHDLSIVDRLQESTFLYVLFDERFESGELGPVSKSSSACEVGFGCYPSGPPDGVEISLEQLVKLVLRALE